jgi:phosphonate transport system substrate-binding protein
MGARGRAEFAGCLCLFLAGAVAALCAADRVAPGPPGSLRIGVVSGNWTGVDYNDATAAIAAWARTILDQRHIVLAVETRTFDSAGAEREALISGRVDAVSMLADQLVDLDPELQPDEVFLAARGNDWTERYALLARRDSGVEDMASLVGKKLVIQANDRTCLAPQWIDLLLARGSNGPAADVLGSVSRLQNPSKAVLQVFFRQADACVVTSNVFALSCELNPQLGKEMRMLALSPELVPSVFFFRRGYDSEARKQLEPAMLALRDTAAGRQILTVFQCDEIVKRPLACLESARQLLREYNRLKARPGSRSPIVPPRGGTPL